MRALKIKKNLWLKPRTCYECGKFDLFARHYLSERCRACSKRHRHGVKRKHDHHKYGKTYQRHRAELIAKHPYCSLCGSSENLTVHHVGGGRIYKSSRFYATNAIRLTNAGTSRGERIQNGESYHT